MAGRSNFVDITSALVFVVTFLVCGGLCQSENQCYFRDRPNDLVFGQNYYKFVEYPKKIVDDVTNALRGSDTIYYGRRSSDIIFNITAPAADVFEVIRLCMFTRNVRSVNVRSTTVYTLQDGQRRTSSGPLYGNFPVPRSYKWQKTCVKPYYTGKVNQVRVQLQYDQRRKKIRVQKLYMEACRCLD